MGISTHVTDTSNVVATILPSTDEQVLDIYDDEEPPGSHVLILADNGNKAEFVIAGNAADLDRWVRRLVRQAAEMMATVRNTRPQTPGLSPRLAAAYVMADVMARVGLSHFTNEHDRLSLADRLLTGIESAGLHIVEREEKKDAPEQPKLPVIPASRPVTLDQLVPGQVVQRWTDPDGEVVTIDMPCCGRKLCLPNKQTTVETVVCQYDRIGYQVDLVDDGDEGLWAYLTVRGPVVVAKPRKPRRRVR